MLFVRARLDELWTNEVLFSIFELMQYEHGTFFSPPRDLKKVRLAGELMKLK